MQNSTDTNLELRRNWLALCFYQKLAKCFDVTENIKNLKFEGDWAEDEKVICSDNLGQNI